MGELTNALQGKLNSRKSHVKDPSEKQLDLFSSLSDREAAAPKIVFSKPEAPAARPEPEWVLPAGGPPPDVASEVRAVLSDSGPARPVEEPGPGGGEKPPLRTLSRGLRWRDESASGSRASNWIGAWSRWSLCFACWWG